MYSEADYLQLLNNLGVTAPEKPKKNKYNAKKTNVDGIFFDSKKEAEYYNSLKLLVRAGELDSFGRQTRFVVTEGDDKTRATEYVTDFILLFPDKTYKIVDVKGVKTEVFKLKMKSLKEKYPKLEIELE